MIALAADGTTLLSAGTADVPMFPRSSNKPFQAAAMLRCGLKLDGELLALAAASHSGEDFHVSGVRSILASAGLTEDDLRCPPDMPLDEHAQRAMIRSGAGPDRVHMNCSGKHAAMLATCVAAGWPTATLHRPRSSAAAGDQGHDRAAGRRAGDCDRRRRLRRPADGDLGGRAGARVPRRRASRAGHGGARRRRCDARATRSGRLAPPGPSAR